MILRFLTAALLLLGVLGAAPSISAPLVAPCTEAGQSSSECDPVNSGNGLPVAPSTGSTFTTQSSVDPALPSGATFILGNSTGSTGAVTGTLAGTSGKTTYICGVIIAALGGTATIGPVTIAGPSTSLVIQMTSTATGNFFNQLFRPCIPASAANTAITTTTTADGTATAVDVNTWGYQK